MFDDSFRPQQRHSMYSSAYPNEMKFVEDVNRMGTNEVLPSRVSGEVELIARSSYRLGHAENAVSTQVNRADELERKLHNTEKALGEARSQVSTYRSRAEQRAEEAEKYREQLIAEHDKFVRLDKKVHPSKYKAKKTAKKASK